MRLWRDVFGITFIAAYLIFFSLSWTSVLADTPKPKPAPHQVLSMQSTPTDVATDLPDSNQLLALTNQARINSGVSVLAVSPTLNNIAKIRADDMAKQRYYAHQSPAGVFYYDLLKNTEFKHAYSCENLGLGYSITATTYLSQWLLSDQGHKECLLHAKTAYVGYGIAEITFDSKAEHSDTKTFVVVTIQASD